VEEEMSAYGKSFLGAVDDAGLHWTLRPFWDRLIVQRHIDGISVHARDDLAVTLRGLPRQCRPGSDAPSVAAAGSPREVVAA
jgi:hypothetical protein